MKLLDHIYNSLLFSYYHVTCGRSFVCRGRLIIQGHGTYQIGDGVQINSKATVNPIGGDRTVLQTLNRKAYISIGNGVGMSHTVLSARVGITIEDHVLLGAGCKLYDNDFHSISYQDRIEQGDCEIREAPIRVKEGAFIGAHSIILKGVTVGRHSVIGAGSVVTKDVPDGEIWAGNPARKIGVAER